MINNTLYYILIFILFILVIFIILMESDRTFNSDNHYDVKYYYWDQYPLSFLGLYNSIIRLTNPSHSHCFNVYDFKTDEILRNNYKLIKDEALLLYNNKNKLLNMKDLSNTAFGNIDSEENLWKVYVLKWYDKISDKARRECPNTCKLIDQCDDVYVVMFSIIEPGKYIPPHKGPSTLCLRYHLGLSIPQDKNNCFITVNNEKFIWEEGKSFIFDDTYEHSVINNTNEPRIILFVDIKRPTNFLTSNLNNWLLSKSNFNHFTKTINDAVEKKQSIIKETFII
jgi:aspartyl/asparaginyl beta-hydroxylase (cupin superfamily)